jgi:hypothetical protein
MNLVFDRTALEILKVMGYRYFCNKEVAPPELDPNEGLVVYWELIPFKSKPAAMKTYLGLRELDRNNYIWFEEEHLAEMADGIFGLEFHVKIAENVFS